MIERAKEWLRQLDDGEILDAEDVSNGKKCADHIEQLESQRDRLVQGIKNLRDVKGRFHTEQAANQLFALLAEIGETK